MSSVSGVHRCAIGSAEFGNCPAQERSAGVERAAVGLGERGSREIKRGPAGVIHRKAAQVLGNQGTLFELFRCGGELIAELSKFEKGAVHSEQVQTETIDAWVAPFPCLGHPI